MTRLTVLLVAACLGQCLIQEVSAEHGHAAADPSAAAAAAAATAAASKAVTEATEAVAHAVETAKEANEAKDYSSVILLGGIAFIMAIYYMVNATSPSIQKVTWQLVSTSVSIFVAVMAYNALKHMLGMIFEIEEVHVTFENGHEAAASAHHRLLSHHGGGKIETKHILLSVGALTLWWILLVVALLCQMTSKLRLVAWGTIGGHILGFSAIDLYGGTIAMTETFKVSPQMQALVIIIYIVTIPIVQAPIRWIVLCFARRANISAENVEQFHEQIKDTGMDFFCMGLSFLLCMVTRGFIADNGHGASPHATSPGHGKGQVWILAFIGILWGLLSGAVRFVSSKAKTVSETKKTLYEAAITTCSLTAAWCMLDTGNWLLLHRFSSPMFAKVMVALLGSLFFVVCTFAFHAATSALPEANSLRKELKAEFLAVCLAVGLAWEHAFDQALDGTGELIADQAESRKDVWVLLLTISLVIVVFPAWTVYMLPKTDKELRSEYGNVVLRPRDAFCGTEEEDDEEEDDYEDEEDEALFGGDKA